MRDVSNAIHAPANSACSIPFPGYTAGKSAPLIKMPSRKSKSHRTYEIGVDPKGDGYFADMDGGPLAR